MNLSIFVRFMPLVAWLVLGTSASAQPISQEKAMEIAADWMQTQTGRDYHAVQRLGGTSSVLAAQEKKMLFRIIELEPRGWAIVASDDRIDPILAYGQSKLDMDAPPPAFLEWMRMMDDNLRMVLNRSDSHSDSTGHRHSVPYRLGASKLGATSYGPLLGGIQWGQGQYYNALTPADPKGPDGHAVVGCVATAMGQAMYYLGLPVHGTGSYTYDHMVSKGFQHDYGLLSANFNTAYDWGNMCDKLDAGSTAAQKDAVSTLLYHIGIAVEMDYGNGADDSGSNAYYYHSSKPSALAALQNYFDFADATYREKSTYTSQGWDDMLQESLKKNYPVLYAGLAMVGGGHAFVLDGYNASSGQYHFNWGYNGTYNGYFSLGNLNPGGTNYSYSQQAIFLTYVKEGTRYLGTHSGSSGGGCSYNPHNDSMDLMMLLMLLLAAFYPLGRRYIR
jgi:hypothetical protein